MDRLNLDECLIDASPRSDAYLSGLRLLIYDLWRDLPVDTSKRVGLTCRDRRCMNPDHMLGRAERGG